MGVECLETFDKVGKITKDYMKLTKISSLFTKIGTKSWKNLEDFDGNELFWRSRSWERGRRRGDCTIYSSTKTGDLRGALGHLLRYGQREKGQGLLSGITLTERSLFLLGLADSDWVGSNRPNLISMGWSSRRNIVLSRRHALYSQFLLSFD